LFVLLARSTLRAYRFSANPGVPILNLPLNNMRVLVTGANGYIGQQIAFALRRKGHIVYGLVRKESDGKVLAASEVTPVIGDLQQLVDGKDNNITSVLDKVTVIIDTVIVPTENPPFATNRALMAAVRQRSEAESAANCIKKRYIFCSGCITYGDHKDLVDENMPCTAKMPRVAWEKEVLLLNKREFETVVVRPSWVYGGNGGAYSARWWNGNDKGEIEVRGDPNKRWGWVHYIDNAESFVLVAEASGAIVGGEIFDVADDTRITFEELLVLMARAHGVKGPVVRLPKGDDGFSNVIEASVVCRAEKIRRVLGWKPNFGTLQDNVELWHAAVKASGMFEKKLGHW